MLKLKNIFKNTKFPHLSKSVTSTPTALQTSLPKRCLTPQSKMNISTTLRSKFAPKKQMESRKKSRPQVYPYVVEWKLSGKDNLNANEIKQEIDELNPEEDAPFVILDIREEKDLNEYDFPIKNQKGAYIPKINIPFGNIMKHYYHNLPKEKTLICICDIGIRSHIASEILNSEGYSVSVFEGGNEDLSLLLENQKDLDPEIEF